MLNRGLAVSRLAGGLPARLPRTAAVTRLAGRRTSAVLPAALWTCRRCSRGLSTDAGVSWATTTSFAKTYPALDTFQRRHIGPDEDDTQVMLQALTPPVKSLDEFVAQVVPADILTERPLFPQAQSSPSDPVRRAITEPLPEHTVRAHAEAVAAQNVVAKSFIGAGYYDTLVPEIIKLNMLENPAWYTSYTPYQPEISQGRLESLLNFQTLVTDLTALPIANASLLDEGTAAAEAVTLSLNALGGSRARRPGKTFVVSHLVHPQTLAVLRGRADGFGIKVEVRDVSAPAFVDSGLAEIGEDLVGVLVQYPDTEGGVVSFKALAEGVHKQGGLLSCATDLLALTVLTPPGEWGADIAFGSAQRLGVPMGFGGPHAAFFAVADKYKRKMPGRLIGVSKDRMGGRALRLALQTREQHIRREKATSNVCTAQALLANMNAMYAIYHGPEGLKAIAERIVRGARILQRAAEKLGLEVKAAPVFDTFVIRCPGGQADRLIASALAHGCNLRKLSADEVGISVDEAKSHEDLLALISAFYEAAPAITGASAGSSGSGSLEAFVEGLLQEVASQEATIPEAFRRTSAYLTHPVFNTYRSETDMLRYIYHLQSKDLSLVHSMIPLGSCTMKLNGSVEMSTLKLPGFTQLHPYVPREQAAGYEQILASLKDQLRDITGMDAVSLQPNSGAQGEFTGLRAIRRYHELHGNKARNVCLIPVSAHGTNPASAAMAGLSVVPVRCDAKTGNLDLADLEAKCVKHADKLAAVMITYPSTFGIFEPGVRRACELVHAHGGLVYMDGANMNAQIGLCSPGEIGADVCHLNLHKTFCIPHGGGGPGSGPICVKAHLEEALPPESGYYASGSDKDGEQGSTPASSAPFGSASILPISWAYNLLMGGSGLKQATKMTLLNANYLLSRLRPHYEIVYTNEQGRCAHEFILDLRPFHATANIEAIDVAKRLQDYGFHAPTMSWPVGNTLMIEPTESESKAELDRFVEALVSIRGEIRDIEQGRVPREGNVLKMAPHPVHDVMGAWDRPYTQDQAAYPLPWLREKKFWPTVARVDDTYGDLNLFCTCPPVVDTTEVE